MIIFFVISGVRPFKCAHCSQAFTQRISLETHTRKIHNIDPTYAHKERRSKLYVCECCGHSTVSAELHLSHVTQMHPGVPV